MILFIGWSGPVSHAVAQALFSWLPIIMPFVEPWISSQDIMGGKQWNPQLKTILRKCDAGIVCFTADNVKSEWLHFEAGSIGLRENNPLLVPYLFDVRREKLSSPIGQFQSRLATLEETLLLANDILRHARGLHFTQVKSIDKIVKDKYFILDKKLHDIRDVFGIPIDAAFHLSAEIGLNFQKIIDAKTNDVIITGQNIQGLLRNGLLPFLHEFYIKNPFFKVLIILAKPEFFKTLAFSSKEKQGYNLQFMNTINNLTEFKSSLPIDRKKDFIVFFHPGVSSLSAIFRDPNNKNRGLVAITPKWATDTEPDNRISFLIDRATNDHLFSRVYGHIGIMNDPVHSETLENMSERLKTI